MREGERGDCFFIIAEGGVNVTRGGKPLNMLKPGDCFGEMLYFSEGQCWRKTTITAAADSLLVEMKASALRRRRKAVKVEFNKAFLRILIEKLSSGARTDRRFALMERKSLCKWLQQLRERI